MKTIYIVRHAKSSWDEPGLSDIDRPLNERGKRDAPEMGNYLRKKGLYPDAIFSSPAKRAHKTAKLIASELGYDTSKIDIQPLLYTFSLNIDDIIQFIEQLPDNLNTIMLFGHNPTFTELANFFSDNHFTTENPTCSVVGIELQNNSWKNCRNAKTTLTLYAYPKMLHE